MRLRRMLVLAVLLGACAGADFRLDPSPSCSYRTEGAVVIDGGTTFTGSINSLVLGQRHACAEFDFDDARCWGGNDLAQLSGRYDPPAGEGLTYDGWHGQARLTAGGAHTCTFNLRVWCWGNNTAGQVDGTGEQTAGIIEVRTGFDFREGSVVAAAGLMHTCAGNLERVVCWGHNGFGQLGRDIDTACCNEPADVTFPPLGGRPLPLQMAAGAYHSCVLVMEGVDGEERQTIYCWGDDRFGALGDGEAGEPRSEPQRVTLPESAGLVTAGPHHTCALLGDENVYCWGRGLSGELGNGMTVNTAVPVLVPLPFTPVSLAAGGRVALSMDSDGELLAGDGVGRTCAVSQEGLAMCWGDNSEGQLGDGTTTRRSMPTPVLGDARFRSVVPGGEATCGVTTDNVVLCWGDGASGQIGSANGSSITPAGTTVFEL